MATRVSKNWGAPSTNYKDIKFDASKVAFESIVDYVLHSLHATDFKISEISIEDIVKSILKEQEEGVKNV